MILAWNGWTSLLDLPPPWAHLVCGPERDLETTLRSRAPANVGAVVRMLRGKRCATKRGLFQEWGAALQFPYYFGENWDAFEECINDLEWLPARAYILAVTHADRLLSEGPDLATLVQILGAASTRWARGTGDDQLRLPVALHVVFHCDPEREAETRARFQQAGTALTALHLP